MLYYEAQSTAALLYEGKESRYNLVKRSSEAAVCEQKPFEKQEGNPQERSAFK